MSKDNDEVVECLSAIESKVDRVLGEHLDPPYEERDRRGKVEYWAEYEEREGEGLTVQRHMIVCQTLVVSLALLMYTTGIASRGLVWALVVYVVVATLVMYVAAKNVQILAKAALWVMDRV